MGHIYTPPASAITVGIGKPQTRLYPIFQCLFIHLLFVAGLFVGQLSARDALPQACAILDLTTDSIRCSNNNQFSVRILVKNNGEAPSTGNLVVEIGGQTFTAPASAGDTLQTIRITLPANGQTLEAKAFYSALPACTFSKAAVFTAPTGCGSIGNLVWEDLNGNGAQDDGPGGIQNVRVALLTCTGDTLAQTLTDSLGRYQFNHLPAGSYKLKFQLGNVATAYLNAVFTRKDVVVDSLDSDVDPASGETPCFNLSAGQQDFSQDAGMYVPVSIGNQVWLDNNRNNIFDPNEPGLGGVPVRLFRCDDLVTPLATLTTGANGLYLFTNLSPGDYRVEFGIPTTGVYERVPPNVGTDATDSDAEENGLTRCYTLQSRLQNLTVDAGYVACGPVNLACIANVNLTMNETCSLKITPGMLLTNLPPCLTNLEVRVGLPNGAPFGDVVTGQYLGRALRAVVIDKLTNNSCSSTLTVLDVTRPTLVCPPNTNKAVSAQQVQLIEGTLASVNPSANMASLNCFRPLVNPGGGNHYYELHSFTVTKADVFTFELSSMFGDGAALLYERTPNGQSLCEGVFAQSYQSFTAGVYFSNLNPILRLTARLVPGKTYTLLTTSRNPAAIGSYEWAVYSDADGLLQGRSAFVVQAAYDLICNDLDQILNKPQSVNFVGAPLASDNCGVPAPNLTFVDQLTDGGNCKGNTITRTFTARDPSGNSVQCTQLISVRKPTLADVIYPPLTAFLECSATFPLDSKGNPSPAVTGYPFIKTAFGNHDLTVPYCNMAATYEDRPRTMTCSGTYALVREWMITDLCSPLNSLAFTQFIQVGDSQKPVVECPPGEDYDGDGTLDTLIFSTTSEECSAAFTVPTPQITDNCSAVTFSVEIISDTLLEIRDEFGFLIETRLEKFVRATAQSSGSLLVNRIPIGDHLFRYTVTDACGNRTVLECPFKVRDLSAPVVLCKSSITVSLGGEGLTNVFAKDLDGGSRDNCAIDSILIRRKFVRNVENCDTLAVAYWSEWDTLIQIGCCDVGSVVEVELKVVDKAGNSNECNAKIEVSDRIRPFCAAPPSQSFPCTSLPREFNPFDTLTLQSLFGVATATDNCGATWQELPPTVSLDDCRIGSITRRFRTVDRAGNTSINTCQQVITITKINNYEIKFPRDAEIQCGAPFADTLQVNRLACDQLSVNVTEERFSGVGRECYRIFRTYRIINFCEYDGTSQPLIIGRDEDCDNNAGDENVWVIRRPGNTFIDRNNVETDNLPAAAQRGCAPANPRGYWRTSNSVGYWQYTQVIRVLDTIPPDVIFTAPAPFCATTDNCNAAVKVPIVLSEACTADQVTTQVTVDLNVDGTSNGTLASLGGTLSGTYPNFEIAGNFALGKHSFEVRVQDGCGNSATEKISFEVVDCKAPQPVCAATLTVNLQPVQPARDVNADGIEDRGAVTVKASSLINVPATDCSGPVRYSINRAGQTPNINRDSLVFTCADLTAPVLVEVYAWDNAANPYAVQPNGGVGGRNTNRCTALLTVRDDALKACAPPKAGLVNGEIRTEDGDPVEGVWVYLSGQAAATTQTALNGKYNFAELDEGYDYTVAPLLDTNHINGVSTIDLVIITRHILGVQPLDSPYKIIAADVNSSKTISTLDLIQIRKLILGIDLKFNGNTSWRFVNAAYRFPVQNNPWFEIFPEVYSLNDLAGTFNNANFVAIKIGDVNLNAETTRPTGGAIVPRSTPTPLLLHTQEQTLQAGTACAVAFRANLAAIPGYQMTLDFDADKLELVAIEHGITQEENFGRQWAPRGLLTLSWHEVQRTPPPTDTATQLFTLIFQTKAAGKLSDWLRVNSRFTAAEAYTAAGLTKPVQLHFNPEGATPPDFVLYQNVPNPFHESTNIGFSLPEATAVTLQILDASGRVLTIVQLEGIAGYNQVQLDKRRLTPGVLYYRLETKTHTATRKMILLN